MASLLRKKLTSVISLRPSYRRHNLTILTPVFLFSTQIQQKESVPFIAQYLISSFGFSEERALRVATDRNLASIKTADRPDSVVLFFKETGLNDFQIKNVISLAPQILSRSVSKTLEPRIREVIAGGFTRETLVQLIQHNPAALASKTLLSHLQFWRNILGNDEDALSKLVKNGILTSMNIEKKIIPLMNFLRYYGFSEADIRNIVENCPPILGFSVENLKAKLTFLTDKAGIKPKKFIGRPYLLTYSLDKRLVPRHYVLSSLKSKGLIKSYTLYTLAKVSEKDFAKRFIKQYEKELPELAETYAAACSGKLGVYNSHGCREEE